MRAGAAMDGHMAEVSDIAVYQKLTQVADDLDQMAAEGATLVGGVALETAAKTVRGMASAVYQHIMADRDGAMDS
jgi:hypothetical protein